MTLSVSSGVSLADDRVDGTATSFPNPLQFAGSSDMDVDPLLGFVKAEPGPSPVNAKPPRADRRASVVSASDPVAADGAEKPEAEIPPLLDHAAMPPDVIDRLTRALGQHKTAEYLDLLGQFIRAKVSRREFERFALAILPPQCIGLHNALIMSLLRSVLVDTENGNDTYVGTAFLPHPVPLPRKRRKLESTEARRTRNRKEAFALPKEDRDRIRRIHQRMEAEEARLGAVADGADPSRADLTGMNTPTSATGSKKATRKRPRDKRPEAADSMDPNPLQGFKPASVRPAHATEYARLLNTPTCAQELELPSRSTLRDRMLCISLECGLDKVADSAIDVMMMSLQSYMKNVTEAVLRIGQDASVDPEPVPPPWVIAAAADPESGTDRPVLRSPRKKKSAMAKAVAAAAASAPAPPQPQFGKPPSRIPSVPALKPGSAPTAAAAGPGDREPKLGVSMSALPNGAASAPVSPTKRSTSPRVAAPVAASDLLPNGHAVASPSSALSSLPPTPISSTDGSPTNGVAVDGTAVPNGVALASALRKSGGSRAEGGAGPRADSPSPIETSALRLAAADTMDVDGPAATPRDAAVPLATPNPSLGGTLDASTSSSAPTGQAKSAEKKVLFASPLKAPSSAPAASPVKSAAAFKAPSKAPTSTVSVGGKRRASISAASEASATSPVAVPAPAPAPSPLDLPPIRERTVTLADMATAFALEPLLVADTRFVQEKVVDRLWHMLPETEELFAALDQMDAVQQQRERELEQQQLQAQAAAASGYPPHLQHHFFGGGGSGGHLQYPVSAMASGPMSIYASAATRLASATAASASSSSAGPLPPSSPSYSSW
ncbi:hypothetical protein H9P43_003695 [Blastocladiella emersonii ATCC 22665]|nr:hypothetical protein H9P43_003695 [Blastocladiella emersonii ATCC 22665]